MYSVYAVRLSHEYHDRVVMGSDYKRSTKQTANSLNNETFLFMTFTCHQTTEETMLTTRGKG